MEAFSAESDTALLDELTGLWNRRVLQDVLQREVARANRYRRPLALVLFDVNDFQRVNDLQGDVERDRVLRGLAERVMDVVGPVAIASRLGGDEFAVVLPQASLGRGEEFAARLDHFLEARPISSSGRLVLSYGIVQLEEGEDSVSLLARADLALHDGRHRPGSPPSGVREPRRPRPSVRSASLTNTFEDDS